MGQQNRNYQKELEQILGRLNVSEEAGNNPPRLFLHSCCAPCSSYVLEYLSSYFEITDHYYNPNIDPPAEYEKRAEELSRLINEMDTKYPVHFLKAEYNSAVFYDAVKGLEKVPEGGERCFICYELRLREAARLASEGNYDYFTTTLSISPLKNAGKLNEIGERLAEEFKVPYLPSDFKKKNGYKRSIELSREYGLYRQDYCGCVFSKAERMRNAEAVLKGEHA